MALFVNFAGASLKKPGAYTRTRVAQGAAAEAQLGVVALVGEADQGDPYSAESGLSAITFSPAQFSSIVEKFGSGPLVDAAKLAFNASNDTDISGGAQQLLVLKTNQSTKASIAMPTSYGTVTARKAGAQGNNLSLTISTSGSQRIFTVSDTLTGVSEVSALTGGATVLTIQATGAGVTAATLTISATAFTTTVTGGTTPSLSIPLSQFRTMSQLAEFIAGQPGYTATVGSGQNNQPMSVMDRVSAVDIFTAPYALKRDSADVQAVFDQSGLVSLARTAFLGLPSNMTKTFLSGGARGATSNANIQSAIDDLMKARVNFLVPLFSRDATADITDGLTDAASGYTIDSIHAMARSHTAQGATVKGRKERQAWVGFKGSYADAKAKSAGIGSARVSLCFQDPNVQNTAGDIVRAQPHMLAVLAAGMKAAAVVGLPNTSKKLQISGFINSDFDPETQADDAIDANLTFVEKAPGGGFRWVLDNSTYGDTLSAWIYNRPAVLYAADTAAFALRLNVETFTGKRNSDVSPDTIKNLLVKVMDSLRAAGIIVPDAASGGKGFTALSVSIEGNVVRFSATLVLVESLEFLLGEITVQRASS